MESANSVYGRIIEHLNHFQRRRLSASTCCTKVLRRDVIQKSGTIKHGPDINACKVGWNVIRSRLPA